MSYSDRADYIIEAAEAKAAADLAELIRILPDELARMPADEHREYLRTKAANLRQWRKDHYQAWLDLPRYGREKTAAWLRAWMIDEADGLKTPLVSDGSAIIRLAAFIKVDGYLRHLAKLLNEEPRPKETPVFGDDLAAIIRPALEKMALLNDAGAFIGKPYHVKALYSVLKRRGYILGTAKAPEKAFTTFFAAYFEYTVGERTLRARPTGSQDDAERELLLLILRKP